MKLVLNKDKMQIEKEQDVVPFRNRVKEYAVKIGMSLINQTKLDYSRQRTGKKYVEVRWWWYCVN
jgi:hypothetical protein